MSISLARGAFMSRDEQNALAHHYRSKRFFDKNGRPTSSKKPLSRQQIVDDYLISQGRGDETSSRGIGINVRRIISYLTRNSH